MTSILVHLFGNSYPTFEDLLRAHKVPYSLLSLPAIRSNVPPNVIEITGNSTAPIDLARLAKTINVFKILIPQRDVSLTFRSGEVQTVLHQSNSQLELLLANTISIRALDAMDD